MFDPKNLATYKVDVLAFGVTFWELLTGKIPFDGLLDPALLALAQQGLHSQHLTPLARIKEKKAAVLINLCLAAGQTYKIYARADEQYFIEIL